MTVSKSVRREADERCTGTCFVPPSLLLSVSTTPDLPGGARRLVQKADGIAATIVNGAVTLRDGEATGALPGHVIKGPLAG